MQCHRLLYPRNWYGTTIPLPCPRGKHNSVAPLCYAISLFKNKKINNKVKVKQTIDKNMAWHIHIRTRPSFVLCLSLNFAALKCDLLYCYIEAENYKRNVRLLWHGNSYDRCFGVRVCGDMDWSSTRVVCCHAARYQLLTDSTIIAKI